MNAHILRFPSGYTKPPAKVKELETDKVCGINKSYVYSWANGKGQKITGLFKPVSGQGRGPNEDNPNLPQPEREVLAYKIDRMMGLKLVPQTVMVKINGKRGSFQKFMSDGHKTARASSPATPTKKVALMIGVFDYLIGNSDRHGNNFMYGPYGVVLIDHGHCFWNYPRQSRPYRETCQMHQCTILCGNMNNTGCLYQCPYYGATGKCPCSGSDCAPSWGKKLRFSLIKRLNKVDIPKLAKEFAFDNDELAGLIARRERLIKALENNTINKLLIENTLV